MYNVTFLDKELAELFIFYVNYNLLRWKYIHNGGNYLYAELSLS